MSSNENILTCNHCHHSWEMLEDCSLKSLNGETSFSHIPDWYEWERSNVRKEIDNGTYSTGKLNALVRSLPNSKGYITLGKATLIHDLNGFKLTSCDNKLNFQLDSLETYCVYSDFYWYSIGDIIAIGNSKVQYYCFPKTKKDVVAKIRLAAEEIYKFRKNN